MKTNSGSIVGELRQSGKKDEPDILLLSQSTPIHLTKADWRELTVGKQKLGQVAEWNGEVVGCAAIWSKDDFVEITYLAVREDMYNRGIGSFILHTMIENLKTCPTKSYVVMDVREDLLDLLNFLKHHDYLAVKLIRGRNGDMDSIRMAYSLDGSDVKEARDL